MNCTLIFICYLIAVYFAKVIRGDYRGNSFSSAFTPAPEPIRFIQLGKIKANLGDGHIVVDLPITDLTIHAAVTLTITSRFGIYDPDRYRSLQETANHTLQTAEAMINSLGLSTIYHKQANTFFKENNHDIIPAAIKTKFRDDQGHVHKVDTQPSPTASVQPKRMRRFIFAAIALAVGSLVAATAVGIYSGGDLIALKNAASKTNTHVNALVSAVKSMHSQMGVMLDAIRKIQDDIVLKHYEQDLYDAISSLVTQQGLAVNHALTAVNSIIHGEIDPSLLPAHTLDIAVQELTLLAAAQNLYPVITKPQEIAELPASYTVTKDGVLTAYIHVPLSSARFDMTLHRLTSLPIATNNGYFKVDIEEKYLAVTHQPTNVFFSLSEADFRQCKIMEGNYVCPHTYDMFKPTAGFDEISEPRCLMALYERSDSDIRQFCPAAEATQQAAVTEIDDYTFALFSVKQDQVIITCAAEKGERTTYTGTLNVHIKPGCNAETNGRYITPHVTIQGTPITSSVSSPSALALFANLSSAALQGAKDERKSIGFHLDLESKALSELSDLQKLQESFNTGHPIAITLAIVSSVCGFLTILAVVMYIVTKKKMLQSTQLINFLRMQQNPAPNNESVTYHHYPSPQVSINTIPTSVNSTTSSSNTTDSSVHMPPPMVNINPISSANLSSTHEKAINFPPPQNLNVSQIHPSAPSYSSSQAMEEMRHVSFDSENPGRILVPRTERGHGIYPAVR